MECGNLSWVCENEMHLSQETSENDNNKDINLFSVSGFKSARPGFRSSGHCR